MGVVREEARRTGRPFKGADMLYEFDCGHLHGEWVMTTTIRRACPICRKGAAVAIHKRCAVCGAEMHLPLRLNRQKYCPACQPRANRAYAIVNKKTNKSYIPAGEIDVAAVLEGRKDPDDDPLDIVFAKYAADPFYRPARDDDSARHRGGSNGRILTS